MDCGAVLRILSVSGVQVLEVLEGHSGAVHCVRFSAEGGKFISASGDEKNIRVWQCGEHGAKVR